jgi:hypothetical protein
MALNVEKTEASKRTNFYLKKLSRDVTKTQRDSYVFRNVLAGNTRKYTYVNKNYHSLTTANIWHINKVPAQNPLYRVTPDTTTQTNTFFTNGVQEFFAT